MSLNLYHYYNKFKRVIVGIPMLWRVEDWSYNDALEIFAWKLDRVRDEIRRTRWPTVNQKQTLRHMTTCIELIKRINEGDYMSTLYLRLYNKQHPNGWEWGPPQMMGGLEVVELLTNKLSDSEERVFSQAINDDVVRERYDREYLFKILSKHMTGWWD